MKDCLFCKIINKEIPSYIVYESKEVVAFLDISPINKGHTLVMPNNHYETFLDIPKNELEILFSKIQEVTKAVIKATNADGSNLLLNNKRAAGQVVDHVHFHVIPRFENDGLKHWSHGNYNEGEDKKIATKIKSFLK